MEWEIGYRMRILDKSKIIGGRQLVDGGIYEVDMLIHGYVPRIKVSDACTVGIISTEMQYVERVIDEPEYELSDAELGEPSESPNVTLSEVYEEICDMKAMIGRLIRNGEESQ